MTEAAHTYEFAAYRRSMLSRAVAHLGGVPDAHALLRATRASGR